MLCTDARRLMRAAGLDRCEISLMLVSDRRIRAINRRFRIVDSPTDVLAFSQLEEAGHRRDSAPYKIANADRRLLGDVVISIDTALRQARELGVTPAERVRTLLIHGFLHLLGYDHERSAAEARRMFARERSLARRIRGTSPRSTALKAHR